MTEAEERAWVEAARRGDEDAFSQIFFRYQGALYNLAQHLVGNPDEAEDVVQQAFIKAFRALRTMRDPGSLGPWLRRILFTTGLDHLRRRKRRAELPLDDRLRHRLSSAYDPERETVLHERQELVHRALQRMSPRYRAYILLREFEGLSYDEIGQVTGEPLTTVRVALFRAREQLRGILRQMAGEGEA
jgi:RNA polymerase sigma-70 factor (ECF subfamily)